MKLVRWNDPFANLTSLHSQLDEIFNEALGNQGGVSALHTPRADVYTEDDKQLIAEVHAPGFSKDDVDVSIHEGVLEIKGQQHEKQEEKDKKRAYVLRESSSSFFRRIALPKHADADNIEAHFEDGILKVIVPFKDLPKPKKISIKAKTSKK